MSWLAKKRVSRQTERAGEDEKKIDKKKKRTIRRTTIVRRRVLLAWLARKSGEDIGGL